LESYEVGMTDCVTSISFDRTNEFNSSGRGIGIKIQAKQNENDPGNFNVQSKIQGEGISRDEIFILIQSLVK
jgi:hypothetical protein